MKKILFCTVIFICTVVSVSCTVTQNISDKQIRTDVEYYQFFEDLVSDVSAWSPSQSDSVMDMTINSVAENLTKNAQIKGIKAAKTDKNSYTLEFSFDDFENMVNSFPENKTQNIFSVKNDAESSVVEFNLNLDNWNTLTEIIPILKDPNLEVYGPVYNNPPYDNRTEEDYYFMIDFIFGSGSEDIKKSNIEIIFTAPSEITETNGIHTENSNSAKFSIPLIDILLLHKPICFYCKWAV